MRLIFTLLIFFLFPQITFCQDTDFTKKTTHISLSILIPELNTEIPISSKSHSSIRIALKPRIKFGSTGGIDVPPTAGLEYRYYVRKSSETTFFEGGYAGLFTTVYFDENETLIAPGLVYGTQNYCSKDDLLFYDLGLGAMYLNDGEGIEKTNIYPVIQLHFGIRLY